MAKSSNKKIPDIKVCNKCNPQLYLKFNFSFISYEKEMTSEDYSVLIKRIKFLSDKTWTEIRSESLKDKKLYFELIPTNQLDIRKEIPQKFRAIFPSETNEKFAIFRIYPNNNPKKARVIGMIRNTIFYIFYIDGNGVLYDH